MPTETELKLALHPDDLPALLAHPMLAGAAWERQPMAAVYFDTPSLDLRRSRMAVRSRRVGRRTWLTVKTAGSSVGGLSRRGEWEAPAPPGEPDFAAIVDDPALAAHLRELAPALQPAFRTDFLRRRVVLLHGGARIEVALDQGQIVAGAPPRQEPILELELELFDGPVDALLDLAHTLALGPGGRRESALRLWPVQRSKAERGHALQAGEFPAPARAEALTLDPDLSPVGAWRQTMLAALTHLQANEAGIRAAADQGRLPDAECIHQARVALRRLRSALRLFAPVLPGRFTAHWLSVWGDLARALGPAREADVRMVWLLPAMTGLGLGEEEQAPLLAHARAEQRAAHAGAVAALTKPTFGADLLAFLRAVLAMPERPSDAARLPRWARQRLWRSHRRLQAAAREALDAGPEGRHRLRLAVKRQRYAMEFLADLLPSRRGRRSMAALTDAQSVLGDLNDMDVARQWLSGLPPDLAPQAVAQLSGWVDAETARRLQGLEAVERALVVTPWRDDA